MANYIGNQPLNGEFKRLDSIESQFNNSSTSFGLKYNNVSQTVGDASQLIVSLNGVIQEPLTSYTLSGVTNIVFASPPSSGDTCFIILLGGIGGTVTPSDNSVTTAKLTNNSVTSAKIVNNTITADDMDSSDNYAFNNITIATNTLVTDAVNDRIGVGTANPTYPLDVEDTSAGFIKGSFVSTGSAHSTITFDNTGSDAASVRVGSNNNDFYVRTSGSEKMRVTSGGYVGIGDNDPEKILHVSYASASTGVNKTASALTDPVVVIENLNDASGNYSGIQFSGSGSSSTDTVASSAIYGFHESRGGTYPYGYMAFYTTNSGGSHTERMRIDNSGNVGIGSNSPTEKLVVNGAIGSSNQSLGFSNGPHRVAMDIINASKIARIGTITGTATPTGDEGTVTFLVNNSEKMRIDTSGNTIIKAGNELRVNRPDDATYGAISHGAAGTGIVYNDVNGDGHHWQFAGSEKARIDASGNLLVGTTSTGAAAGGSGTSGININASGAIEVARSANPVMFVNRTTSDGDIMQFRKDGSTVGSIGTAFGYMHLGEGVVGLGFRGADNTIYPYNVTAALARDGAIKLGSSSYRFSDLYLSGGVYVGGTGSANYLNDYEEGTWTPTFVDGTVTTNNSSGEYTKVGNSVFVNINLNVSGVSSLSTSDVGTLPFTPNEYTTMAVFPITGFEQLGAMLCAQPATNGRIQLYYVNNASGNNYVRITDAHLNEGSQISLRIAGVYTTNS